MYPNPDWDPLQALKDIAEQQLKTTIVINQLVELHNQLNRRITLLEKQANGQADT